MKLLLHMFWCWASTNNLFLICSIIDRVVQISLFLVYQWMIGRLLVLDKYGFPLFISQHYFHSIVQDLIFTTLHYSISSRLCYSRAADFGLMKIDQKGRILSFSEKPKGEDLKAMVILKLVMSLESNLEKVSLNACTHYSKFCRQ